LNVPAFFAEECSFARFKQRRTTVLRGKEAPAVSRSFFAVSPRSGGSILNIRGRV
jgi:hypothetical protein